MIVYIATYPRSGNSLLRDIIHNQFQRVTANIYPHEVPYPKRLRYAVNWRLKPSLREKLARPWLVWNNFIALYDLDVPPYTRNMRFLVNGCRPALTTRNRRRLAAEKDIFFLKTHRMPYPRYFRGECVIQVVRHPGPLLRSYRNLVIAAPEYADRSLEYFIRGTSDAGSWSAYHDAWTQAAHALGSRFLRVHYETVTLNPRAACEAIASLTGLSYNLDASLRNFDSLRQQDPHMYGFGSNDNWEQAYTPEQLTLLRSLHSATAAALGYPL